MPFCHNNSRIGDYSATASTLNQHQQNNIEMFESPKASYADGHRGINWEYCWQYC